LPWAKVEQEDQHITVRHGKVPVCDFCLTPQVTHSILAGDFRLPDPVPGLGTLKQWSRGNWSACDTCAALIQQDDWDGLVARAMKALGVLDADIVRALYDALRVHARGMVAGVFKGGAA
jgi:hypothetical protein